MRFHPKGDTRKTCVEQCASIDVRGLLLDRPCHAVAVEYTIAGRTSTPTIGLTTTPTFVRRRLQYWFLCPRCHRRCGVLYLPPQQAELRCRQCWDLHYHSQQTTKNQRARERRYGMRVPQRALTWIRVTHYYEMPRERRPLAPWLRRPIMRIV